MPRSLLRGASLPRRRESSDVKGFWIPVFTGMTFLEAPFSMRFLLKGIMGLGGRFLTVGIGNKVHEFSMDLLYYKEISLQS